MKRVPLSLITLILSLAIDLSAQIRNQVFVGARPLGMGETFVAVANDGNAIYWNPAGLPMIDHYSLYGVHANLYNTGVKSNYVSFFLPFTERLTLGADWFNIGFGDDELEYFDNKFNLALGYKISDQLSLGLNLKHLRIEGKYWGVIPGDILSNPRAQGFGADFGLLFSPLQRLRLGVMAHDVGDTKVKHNGGDTEVIQPRNLRFGAAYQLLPNLLVAADWDDRLHLGSELWLANFLALRAGWQKDRHTDEGSTYAFGVGIEQRLFGQILRLDYAYTVPPALPDMQSFSASILFDLFAPLVKIEKVEIAPVYASLYKHYSENSIGTATINYKGREQLNYKINVTIPGYARSYPQDLFVKPATHAQEISNSLNRDQSAGTADSVSLKTVFTESVLAVEDNTPLTAEVTISYAVNRRAREVKRTETFNLFHRNQLDWSRGIEQAAAFIDPHDNTVDAAANELVDRIPAEWLIAATITKAKKIFEGLGLDGFIYREDPVQPYRAVSTGLDNVYYPYQLLHERRQGDCDDLTVLYAALLENRDIATALVYVPGHIFLMFDSGIHERLRDQICLPDSMYRLQHQHVWIPVEVTAVGSTFDEAWQLGAENFQKHSAGDIKVVEVSEAWKAFKPAVYPQVLKRTAPPAVDTLKVRPFALNQNRSIRAQQLKYLNSLEQQLSQQTDSLEQRNRLARSYAQIGELAKAETHLRAVLAQDSTNYVAYNNLGNVYFLQSYRDSTKAGHLITLAEATYFKALSHSRSKDDSTGTWLNLAMLYQAVREDSIAREVYASVIQDSLDVIHARQLLGIEEEDSSPAGRGNVDAVSAAAVSEQLEQALSRGPKRPPQRPARPVVRPKKPVFNLPGKTAPYYWAF